MDDDQHWDTALRILQQIDPKLVLSNLDWKDKLLGHLRLRIGTQQKIDNWLEKQKPNTAQVSAGVATAPLRRDRES